MLQLLIFIVYFMCLLKLPIPTSLVDQSHLTRFRHGYEGLLSHVITRSDLEQ